MSGAAPGPADRGDAHHRALERLYATAPVNRLFPSRLHIPGTGLAEIRFAVTAAHFHAAGASHGTIYFKMLDDAAFYAAATLVRDVFVLTTQFNLFLTRPLGEGPLLAHGRWVSGERRMLLAESRLLDSEGR
ncbi:MAG: PaaI family thioesterase, partial [Thermaurantiacus sp.]